MLNFCFYQHIKVCQNVIFPDVQKIDWEGRCWRGGGLSLPQQSTPFFSMALQRNSDLGRLAFRFLDGTQLDTHTHTRQDSSDRVTRFLQGPLTTQHTAKRSDEHPCPQWDSNLQSQQSSVCRPVPQTQARIQVFYAPGPKKILRHPPICSYSVMCKQKQHKKLTKDKTLQCVSRIQNKSKNH